MSLRDFRKLIELGEPGTNAYIGVVVEHPEARRPIQLEANLSGVGITLLLDESEAGELFDALAQALRELVTAQAQRKLRPDTPSSDGPVSEGSASIPNRG